MKWHPLDEPKFREWIDENDIGLDHFHLGLYDSKWGELYETFKEETGGGDA